MPKQPLQEIFSQGLVTSRPSHMLSSGELARAEHVVYRENNVALQRAPDHGFYSPDNLSAYFANSTVTGLLSANFEGEEYPDQLIVRVGDDLLSSDVTGPSNNTFQPITFPGRVTGTFGAIPTAAHDDIDFEATEIYPNSVGAFNGHAVVGRAIYSTTAFPASQTTIITAVTMSGNNVASFTVNTPAAAADSAGGLIYFAPKCALNGGYMYAESVGFSARTIVVNVADALQTSSTIDNCISSSSNNGYYFLPPSGSATAFNAYAAVGRRVSVKIGTASKIKSSGTTYPDAAITKVEVTAGNVTKVWIDRPIDLTGETTTTSNNTLKVVFFYDPRGLFITGVADVLDANTDMPVYTSCYLNYFPPAGDVALVFAGGLARRFANTNNVGLDGLSWDGSLFIWDSANPPHRLEYRNRASFNPGELKNRAIVGRPVGLLPVIASPTVNRYTNGSPTTGAWNAGLGTGVYWILITEAYVPLRNQNDTASNALLSGNLLESAYLAANDIQGEGVGSGIISGGVLDEDATPLSAEASGRAGRPIPFKITNVSTDYVTLTMPAPRNNGSGGYFATHWCIYIAGWGESFTAPPPLTSFTRTHIEAMDRYTAGQVITLKDKQVVQLISDLDQQTTTPVFGKKNWTRHQGSIGWVAYSGEVIEVYTPTAYEASSGADYTGLSNHNAFGDFLLPTVATGEYAGLVVTGLEVEVAGIHAEGTNDGQPWFSVDIGTTTSSNYKYTAIRLPQSVGVMRLGGPRDTWDLTKEADWFTLRVRYTKIASNKNSKLYLSAPLVRVHYSTTSINFNGPAYRGVTYRAQVGTADLSDPAALPPPRASIGDTFQGSLVLNDVAAPSFLRYSMPDQPEHFPSPYRLKMGTKRKGRITAIKAFKQVLVVGMERAIKRVNYLPKETDTDFTQGAGLSHEDISSTHGIVGPDAITDFDMPGMGPLLAYVSTIGLRMTNGIDSRALNTDIILGDYVHPDHWDKCMLRAFPNQKWLVLYYVPKGSTHGVRSKCFYFSYSEDHIKGSATIVLSGNAPLTGPLAVTGPCDCYVEDSCDVVINSSPQIATTDGQYVYIEDSAEETTPVRTVTDPDDATRVNRVNVPNIKSRDIFPAGFTMDSNIGSVYLMHETKGSQYIITGTTSTANSVTLDLNTGWGAREPQVGERLIHGGWDSPPSILAVSPTTLTLSSPAVRAFTGTATVDTGVIMVRVNAAQFGEDEVPILTEYRSTSVGVGQVFLMDATANRFSIEIVKTENPNTGALNDLAEDMSIIGVVYHAASSGETSLHAN